MKNKDIIQQEALEAVLPYRRSTAVAGTGVGKTLLGLKHMSVKYHDTIKYLVVIPKLTVIDEWKNQAIENGLEILIPHMKFSTYLSLTKQDLDDDNVYLDEVHNLLETHREWLKAHPGEFLGLTGTPPKWKTSEKGKLINEFCPIRYEYVVDDAVGDGILNDYEIIVHMLDLDHVKNIPVVTPKVSFFTSEKATYDYWTGRVDNAVSPKQKQIASVMRMKAMQGFLSKETLCKKVSASISNKCIIFANTKEQADRLCSHSFHSSNHFSKENLELFKEGTLMKLSAVHQLSEGINIPDLKEGIILHSYGGSSPKAKQKFGRLLRLSPDDKCILHIFCYRNTVDERWVQETLESLDQTKIRYV